MNIIKVLTYLMEDVAVDKIKAATAGKVNPGMLDSLESKMKENRKGKFYDNTAMAIIKFVQNLPEDEHKKYIESHASMIYTILNRAKKGNSSFDMNQTLADSVKGKDNDFWRNMWSQARAPKVEMSKAEKAYNTPGLKTARTKEINDAYLIFPKTYYKQYNGYRIVDIEKSAEDIRKISAEIAAKDTEGGDKEGPIWGNEGGGKRGANVNHWCVASSNSNYFSRYKQESKDRDANFVIIIKKLKNGAPDWNNRYLFASFGNGNYEFADKWDHHVEVLRTFKPGSDTVKYLMQFMQEREAPSKRKEIRDQVRQEIENVRTQADNKAFDDRMSNYTKTEEKNIKKIFKYCKKNSGGPNPYGDAIKLFKDFDDIKTGAALSNYFDKNGNMLSFSNAQNTASIKLVRTSKTNVSALVKTSEGEELEFKGTPAATVKTLRTVMKDGSAAEEINGHTADDFLRSYHGYKIDDQKIKLKHTSLQSYFNEVYNRTNSPEQILKTASKGKDVSILNKFKIVNNKKKQRHDVFDLKTKKIIGYLEDPNFKIE